jgi:hypothetical protein
LLIEDELSISLVKDILAIELDIPSYQRAYRWKEKTAVILFNDIFEAYQNKNKEYRLGSVILHKSKDGQQYSIVDGQQRLTTISILLHVLGYKENTILDVKYKKESHEAIGRNLNIFKRKINEHFIDNTKEQISKKQEFLDFVLYNCTFVKIVTDEEQEAFQFFDSQNNRGKTLDPHDLLKSYHLREMNNDPENIKIELVKKWESFKQTDLAALFSDYLFPITQWIKGKNGINYNIDKIEVFKGVQLKNTYQYAFYHKAANLFIEQLKKESLNECFPGIALNQFQLDQPIIAGKRFFEYIYYYATLLEKVRQEIEEQYLVKEGDKEKFIPKKGAGDVYIKRLMECLLILIADRFSLDELTKPKLDFIYTWAYSFRLEMYSVYLQSINNYARGLHDRLNNGIPMFELISNMNNIKEIDTIILEQVSKKHLDKDIPIAQKIKEITNWDGTNGN